MTNPRDIDRREAIRRVSLMLGGATLVGGSGLIAACESADRPAPGAADAIGDFTAADIALLDEVAETVLPETDTPGAKAAAVGAFMALMVTDTYYTEDQATFRAGLASLEEASIARHGVSFVDAAPESRVQLLEGFDREQFDHEAARAAGSVEGGPHWFRMVKELTLLGYFTSEIGCTIAQRYVETPQRWDPCLPYTPGETTWARHA